MSYPLDVTGERYGRLVAVAYRFSDKQGRHWLFKCDCGKQITRPLRAVRQNGMRSCGCLNAEYLKSEEHRLKSTTHGMTRTKEFRSWIAAKDRCFNSRDEAYDRYGGRGITMHGPWINDFAAFYAYLGPCPAKHTLDRIDVNGNYAPGNVRWASYQEQGQNQRSTKLSPDIVRQIRQSNEPPTKLAKALGVTYCTVWRIQTNQIWTNIT